MKKAFILFFLLMQFSISYGQLALNNSRTLYDTFENPSQKAFYADSSRKFAFNFFIPTISYNTNISGEAETTVKKLLNSGVFDASDLSLGDGRTNKVVLNANTYLASFKIFNTVKFHREMGFAWQIRSDTYGDITNETVAIFHNYNLFVDQSFTDPFNSKATNINYHQFSFTYREDYNRRLGLGLKLSYLSGIAHSDLNIQSSSLNLEKEQDAYSFYLSGKFKSNTSWDDTDKNMLVPGFKNPGLALSLSANYKMKRGWYLLGNLKDLGFIRWNKKDSYIYTFNDNVDIDQASSPDAENRLGTELQRLFDQGSEDKAYTSVINGKAEVLLNKDYGFYQPNLFISKNLFYEGGEIALINTLRHRALNLSLTSGYNFSKYYTLGAQFMIKSPNTEFYLGSDQLIKSYQTAKGIISSDSNYGNGGFASSFYLGFALKFGPEMQRQQNATSIPGIGRESGDGLFGRLFKRKGRL